MDLCVAGLPIRVESADKEFFNRRFVEYVCRDGREPVMTMHTRRLEHIAVPQGETIAQVKNITVVRLPDGRFCRYARGVTASGELGPVLFAIYHTSDYSRVDIDLFIGRRNPDLTLTDFEYLYTGISFQNRLSYLGGGVIHSSALAYNGQGVAFSAHSGTGKSTHTGLWKDRFSDAVTIINDDKPAIYFENGRAMICGTPWSGKTDLNRNLAVPLHAIVFLQRGEENAIRRLDTVEGMLNLTTQIARPYYDESLGVRVLDFTERLLVSVPIYGLTCNISHHAVETAFNAIFSQEEKK